MIIVNENSVATFSPSVAFSVAGYPAPSRTEDDPDRYRAASDDGEGGPGLGEQEAAFPQLATLRVGLGCLLDVVFCIVLMGRF